MCTCAEPTAGHGHVYTAVRHPVGSYPDQAAVTAIFPAHVLRRPAQDLLLEPHPASALRSPSDLDPQPGPFLAPALLVLLAAAVTMTGVLVGAAHPAPQRLASHADIRRDRRILPSSGVRERWRLVHRQQQFSCRFTLFRPQG